MCFLHSPPKAETTSKSGLGQRSVIRQGRPCLRFPGSRHKPSLLRPSQGKGLGVPPLVLWGHPTYTPTGGDLTSQREALMTWAVVSVSLVQEESSGSSSPPWGARAGRDLFSPKVPMGVLTGARVLRTRWLFCSNQGWPARAPGWTLAWYWLPQALWSLLNSHRTEVSHLNPNPRILTLDWHHLCCQEYLCCGWSQHCLGTTGNPLVICALEELKEGRRSQSKCVNVLENPELSLDLPLSKIITT